MPPNYYRGSRTIGSFAKAALLFRPSGFLVPLQAPPSPSYQLPVSPPTNMFRLQTQLQSCLTLLAGDGLAPESWLEGNAEAHISLARAKHYSDVAFQTDTNCSSNKHRKANPRTFITVGKDERKDSHKRLLRAGLARLAQGEVVRPPCTPGVFSLEGLKPSTAALGFAFIVTSKACISAYTSHGEQGEEINMGQVPLWADRPYLQLSMVMWDSWLQGLPIFPPTCTHKTSSRHSVIVCRALRRCPSWPGVSHF